MINAPWSSQSDILKPWERIPPQMLPGPCDENHTTWQSEIVLHFSTENVRMIFLFKKQLGLPALELKASGQHLSGVSEKES